MYKDVLAKIAETFSQGEYKEPYATAREIYFNETGKVFEDDIDFEIKTSAFLEWYLLEYVLDKQRKIPAEIFLIEKNISYEEKVVIEALLKSRRSLFMVKNAKKNILQDLIHVESSKIKLTENTCLLYTSPSPRDRTRSRMPSSA